MSVPTKSSGRTQELLDDSNDIEVYQFDSLRDEIGDVADSDTEQDAPVAFEQLGNDLNISFATETEKLESASFEEEAFGVKKPIQVVRKDGARQIQSNVWKKDPFSSRTVHTATATKKTNGNRVTKSGNHAASSDREISAGISFASILSGKERSLDGNNKPEEHTHSDTVDIKITSTSPEKQKERTTTTLQEIEANVQQRLSTGPSKAVGMNLTEIEARLSQQRHQLRQQQTSGSSLLHQLLPGLSQQQPQQQRHPTELNHARFDSKAFFQTSPTGYHQRQQSQMVTMNKPNLTTEQEAKQKEEDDLKGHSDDLVTVKDQNLISHFQAAAHPPTSDNVSPSDSDRQMYKTQQQPFHKDQYLRTMTMGYNTPSSDTEQCPQSDLRTELDDILDHVKQTQLNREPTKICNETDTSRTIKPLDAGSENQTVNDNKQLLKTIESIYFLILQVEQSCRQLDANLARGQSSNQEAISTAASARKEAMERIWNILAVDKSEPMIIAILSMSKGMSLIGRLIPYLDNHQQLMLTTIIAYHFVDVLPTPSDSTDKHISQYQQQQRQHIDYLHPSVTRCMENTFFHASLSYISQIISIVSQHLNFEALVGSKTGHRFLGSLLFHAKGKQQGSSAISEKEIDGWHQAYDLFFTNTMAHSSLLKDTVHLENVECWLLLNSMAGLCDQQGKEKMLIEFKEIVSTTMKIISDLTRNQVHVPAHIQMAMRIVSELWATLSSATQYKENTS